MEPLDGTRVIRIRVKVVPNSRKFSLQPEADGSLRVKLSEPAEKGRANRELIERLSEEFGCSARIAAGHAGKSKLVELGLAPQEFRQKLEKIAEKSSR